MSILNLKKASVFKNKLLTTEQKKLVRQNLSFEAELSDELLNYDGAIKNSLDDLNSDLAVLENESNTFIEVTNEITEIIINANIKITTKLENLKNKGHDFSKELSSSRNFVKDFEKFKKTSIEQIEKIKALVSLGNIRGFTSSKKFLYFDDEMTGLVQRFSKIITGFFLKEEANKKLFDDVSESNKKRRICQTQIKQYEKEQSALMHAEQMELSLVDEYLKNEKLIIKGRKSDSALQASLLKETHKNHDVLMFLLLGGLVSLGVGVIYYIYQENMYMEDFEELFYSIIVAIVVIIIGAVTFETGWGALAAVAGVFYFFSTIWESAFALSALAILGIFGLGFVLLGAHWDSIENALKKGNIDKISKKITNLKNSANNEIQTSTENAQTKKTEIKTNFRNDLVDLSCLSVPSIDYLKKTFKNLDVAKGFDYAAFKQEGKASSKALSDAEINDEINAKTLQTTILLQLKNEITLADLKHDLRKGPSDFDDSLKRYEGLLDKLCKQANYVEKIIEDTEGNLDRFEKIAAQLQVINLKEAKG